MRRRRRRRWRATKVTFGYFTEDKLQPRALPRQAPSAYHHHRRTKKLTSVERSSLRNWKKKKKKRKEKKKWSSLVDQSNNGVTTWGLNSCNYFSLVKHQNQRSRWLSLQLAEWEMSHRRVGGFFFVFFSPAVAVLRNRCVCVCSKIWQQTPPSEPDSPSHCQLVTRVTPPVCACLFVCTGDVCVPGRLIKEHFLG